MALRAVTEWPDAKRDTTGLQTWQLFPPSVAFSAMFQEIEQAENHEESGDLRYMRADACGRCV